MLTVSTWQGAPLQGCGFAPLISCFIDPVIIYFALKFNPVRISAVSAQTYCPPFLKLDVFKVSAPEWTGNMRWFDEQTDTSSTSDSFVPEDKTAPW